MKRICFVTDAVLFDQNAFCKVNNYVFYQLCIYFKLLKLGTEKKDFFDT